MRLPGALSRPPSRHPTRPNGFQTLIPLNRRIHMLPRLPRRLGVAADVTGALLCFA
jgi:hypothetical protein